MNRGKPRNGFKEVFLIGIELGDDGIIGREELLACGFAEAPEMVVGEAEEGRGIERDQFFSD